MQIQLNMTKVKQNFQILVWYRFVIGGEQEKDYEVHDIDADDVQEAVNKASDLYKTHKAIPFQFLYKGEKFAPTNFTKQDIFNLTSPVL